MKKLQCVKKGKRYVYTAVLTATLLLSMTACGSTQTANPSQDIQEVVLQGEYYSGEIVAIDGSLITLEAAHMNKNAGEETGSEAQERAEPGEKPDGKAPEEAEPGEKPEDIAPEEAEPEKGPGNGASDDMVFVEPPRETVTFEVTDSTVITIGGETAELADLQIGDNIMFTVEGDVITSIHDGTPEERTEAEPPQESKETK
ncbi:MAG: hypothetical protein ACI4AB_06215 [Acetatifactor sp.]